MLATALLLNCHLGLFLLSAVTISHLNPSSHHYPLSLLFIGALSALSAFVDLLLIWTICYWLMIPFFLHCLQHSSLFRLSCLAALCQPSQDLLSNPFFTSNSVCGDLLSCWMWNLHSGVLRCDVVGRKLSTCVDESSNLACTTTNQLLPWILFPKSQLTQINVLTAELSCFSIIYLPLGIGVRGELILICDSDSVVNCGWAVFEVRGPILHNQHFTSWNGYWQGIMNTVLSLLAFIYLHNSYVYVILSVMFLSFLGVSLRGCVGMSLTRTD